MSKKWDAPRVAYELAAEWAAEMAARRGPGGELPARAPGIGKAWHDLTWAEQRDILTALSAQARASAWDLRNGPAAVDVTALAARALDDFTGCLCDRSRAACRILCSAAGGPWEVPECRHCRELVACALISLHWGALRAGGVTDPGAALRTLADGIEVPARQHRDRR
jgi:hypothetical protein